MAINPDGRHTNKMSKMSEMSCYHNNADRSPTIRKKWDDIKTFDVLVEQNRDDSGSSTSYYRLIKTNEKSGWIAHCNRDGEMWKSEPLERLPRRKISRNVLVQAVLMDKP